MPAAATLETLPDWATPDMLAVGHQFPYPMAEGFVLNYDPSRDQYEGQLIGPAQYLGYLTLFDRFAENVHGMHQHLNQPKRYGAFQFDEANNGARMTRVLGASVDPRDHMQQVYANNRDILYWEYMAGRLGDLLAWLPAADLPLVRFIPPIHDMGECTHESLVPLAGSVVGDVEKNTKTGEQKLTEANVLDVVLTMYYPDLPPRFRRRAQAIIAHDPEETDSPAHIFTEWSHNGDRLDTAINAARAALRIHEAGGPNDHEFRQARALALDVGPNVIADLEPASHLLYIAHKLRVAKPLIATAKLVLANP